MLLVFARAGEFYPALSLFKARLEQEGQVLAADGFICNIPLKKGERLVQLEPHKQEWQPMKDGVSVVVPKDQPATKDTYVQVWRSLVWTKSK